MANTTTGLAPDFTVLPSPPAPNVGFVQGSPQGLNIGVNPFGYRDWPTPRGAQPLTQDLFLVRFLGLPTTSPQPVGQVYDWPLPSPKHYDREARFLRGLSNFTPYIIGFPLVQLVKGGRMSSAQVVAGTYGAAGGAMSNAKLVVQGLMP